MPIKHACPVTLPRLSAEIRWLVEITACIIPLNEGKKNFTLESSLQPACYPDIAVRREVKKLQVVCKNKQLGCDFIGKLEKYFSVRKIKLARARACGH